MVDCPECGGTGWVVEEGLVESNAIKCDVCHGSGQITQQQYEQWSNNVIDVYEAARRYLRSLAD